MVAKYVNNVSTDNQGDRIIAVMKRPLVDMLIQIELETYQSHYVIEKGKKVLCLHVKKAI